MPTKERWGNMKSLIGLTIKADDTQELQSVSDSIRDAHLKRHPRNSKYMPVNENKPLSKSEEGEYDRLNLQLHEELRRVSKEHFSGMPSPPGVDSDRFSNDYFTPFTYQNYDWYGPSYECYIIVLTDYISADLLGKFQSLLTGELQDWCIKVVGSNTPDFRDDYEITVFSDEIIIPSSVAGAIGVPQSSL